MRSSNSRLQNGLTKVTQMGFLRSTLCIVLIAAIISPGLCCSKIEWECNSSDCISSEKVCDGKADCIDKSDETASSCIQRKCPQYAYRCAYGACVSGNAMCNGVKDCEDNSDELSCEKGKLKKTTTCSYGQYQCNTGDCIDQDRACDGNVDCSDQSDETVEACASNNCPSYAFRCGYGACIDIGKKCDHTPDCRDESDEAFNLCSNKTRARLTPPSRLPDLTSTPTPTSKPSSLGCIAPNITNSRLVYESDPTIEIKPGENVPHDHSMLYQCKSKYSRVGREFNICRDSKWLYTLHPECIKYCPPDVLKGITFKTQCEFNGTSVGCSDRIRPRTNARVSCEVKYRKPDRNPPDVLVCQEDGNWDYEPFRCEPICGEELPLVKPFVAHGGDINITEVPWHVGIYMDKNLTAVYEHHCAGTIISAKVIISAAHCFWDAKNQATFDKAFYLVGAGKYYREYKADELGTQFENISEIAIPKEYTGDVHDFKGDIAVLVLNNFLRFSAYIAPVCIEWKLRAEQAVPSRKVGRVAGWGRDESYTFSEILRYAELKTSSYENCKNEVGEPLASAVTNDKFCVLNRDSQMICEGDSGGGFNVKKNVGVKNLYYLWGVVSGGLPNGRNCEGLAFVTFTNIQYYRSIIEEAETKNRPK